MLVPGSSEESVSAVHHFRGHQRIGVLDWLVLNGELILLCDEANREEDLQNERFS